jgi:hypothetical protein
MLDVPALRRAVEIQPPPVEEAVRDPRWLTATTFARRRVVQAALLSSLVVNGFFVADLVTGGGDAATQVAVRMVTLTGAPSTSSAITTVPAGKKERSSASEISTRASSPFLGSTGEQKAARAKASATHLLARSIVERKVVSLILTAPARKLPRDFIDASTGLVKNNVQVVCRKRKRAAFLCAVRLPSESRSKALYVRYSAGTDGRGEFRWYGYRNKQS